MDGLVKVFRYKCIRGASLRAIKFKIHPVGVLHLPDSGCDVDERGKLDTRLPSPSRSTIASEHEASADFWCSTRKIWSCRRLRFDTGDQEVTL